MAVIGIDLGTTYSAVAVSEDGVSARVLPNLEGLDTTPSVVYFPDTESGAEEPLVGAMAKNSAAAAPSAVVRSIKRMMGDPDYRYYSLNGNEFHPEEVSAPVEEGQKLGEMIVYLDGEEHERVDLVASAGVARLTVWGIFQQLLDTLLFLPTNA